MLLRKLAHYVIIRLLYDSGEAEYCFSGVRPRVCVSLCLSAQKLKNYSSEIDEYVLRTVLSRRLKLFQKTSNLVASDLGRTLPITGMLLVKF